MPANRLLLLSFVALAPAALAQSLGGHVENVTGLVQARNEGEWSLAGPGQPLEAGVSLRTGEESRATATLGRTLISLDPVSHLDLVRVDETPQAILSRGGMWMVVGEAPLQVATPRGVAEILSPGRYVLEAGDAVVPTRLSVVAGEARMVTMEGATAAAPGQIAWVALDNVTRMGAVAPTVQNAQWPGAPRQVMAAAATPAPSATLSAPGEAPAVGPVIALAALAATPVVSLPAAEASSTFPAVAPATPVVDRPAATRATSTSRSAARVAQAPTNTRQAAQRSRGPSRQAAQASRAPSRPAAQAARAPSQASARAAHPQARPAAATQRQPAAGSQRTASPARPGTAPSAS